MSEEMRPDAAALFSVYGDNYRMLYTAAYAVTGSAADVEKALCALFTREKRVKGMKALREAVINEALFLASCNGDAGAFSCLDRGGDSRLEMRLQEEDDVSRRAAFLTYGCGLNEKQTAQALKMKASSIRAMLKHIRNLCDETAPGKGEKQLIQLCRKELAAGICAPGESAFIRILEKYIEEEPDAADGKRTGRKIVTGFVAFVLLAAIVVLMWLGGVMLDYYRTVVHEKETVKTEETNGGI